MTKLSFLGETIGHALCMAMNGVLPVAMFLFTGNTFAQPESLTSNGEMTTEWTTTLPCAVENAKAVPGQPRLGLALFRFECPGSPARFVSARRKLTISALAAVEDITRGSTPVNGQVKSIAPITVYRVVDIPVKPSELGSLQSRRLIGAGEPLLARDFEPRKLWNGGEPVTVMIKLGAVSTTLPGIALGVGRQGEKSSAKIDNGKTFFGIATLDAGSAVLLVQQ